MTPPLPILPTTVIGSYSMPEWLERAKNEYLSRRLSRRDLDEMHDAVRKAAIKDQEIAGIDIVSDGEAQRDNMIDYFTERMPGVQVDQGSKRFYYDFYESVVRSKLATGTLGLSEEAKFLGRFTDHSSTKRRSAMRPGCTRRSKVSDTAVSSPTIPNGARSNSTPFSS